MQNTKERTVILISFQLKNKTMNLSTKISLRVIAMFVTCIFASLIPDNFHSFFGDVLCNGNLSRNLCNNGWTINSNSHGLTWHWGFRHWLFLFMGISLCVVQIIDIIYILSKESKNANN